MLAGTASPGTADQVQDTAARRDAITPKPAVKPGITGRLKEIGERFKSPSNTR
jgi:hypothetical protein